MSNKPVIIAASDSACRNRMARMLSKQGERVEATDSAACLMAALLHGGQPIVILVDGLEEGLSLTSLVPLLRRCNRHATIIMAAVDLPLEEEIRIHRYSIFCRTGWPVGATGENELQQAVACAQRRLDQFEAPPSYH